VAAAGADGRRWCGARAAQHRGAAWWLGCGRAGWAAATARADRPGLVMLVPLSRYGGRRARATHPCHHPYQPASEAAFRGTVQRSGGGVQVLSIAWVLRISGLRPRHRMGA
jgi:hypothetical protein